MHMYLCHSLQYLRMPVANTFTALIKGIFCGLKLMWDFQGVLATTSLQLPIGMLIIMLQLPIGMQCIVTLSIQN